MERLNVKQNIKVTREKELNKRLSKQKTKESEATEGTAVQRVEKKVLPKSSRKGKVAIKNQL